MAGTQLSTSRFVVLGHDFAVVSTDHGLGRYLDRLFAPFAVSGTPESLYSLTDEGPDAPARYTLEYDGEVVTRTDSPSVGFRYLLWHVNQQAVRSDSSLVMLHAAAAEHGHGTVLLPGSSGSGKSTLVAALVRAGLDYLSDEVAAVDPQTLAVRPVPKAVSLDPGSWGALAQLRPVVDARVAPYVEDQWQVLPDAIRAGCVGSGSAPILVVAPRYEAGIRAHLAQCSAAEAMMLLARNTFAFAAGSQVTLDVLAGIARRCRCYQLTYDDLHAACALVEDLLAGVVEARA